MTKENYKKTVIPEKVVARLPLYRRIVRNYLNDKVKVISSEELAEAAMVNSATVRRDFTFLGSLGVRGSGYDLEVLDRAISQKLGVHTTWPVIIAGAGNLGRALTNSPGFNANGFAVVGLFDIDPRVIDTMVGNLKVEDMSLLGQRVIGLINPIGVIATPPSVAETTAHAMAEANIRSILNFTPVLLRTDKSIRVRNVDLSLELEILAFYLKHG
ncbi:MAG: redox-sensing transcriptional repressor Rex [Firmicutes bacterium]|nr:redox-sensing transcriptional repressor Rex [Bacillota bacterium]